MSDHSGTWEHGDTPMRWEIGEITMSKHGEPITDFTDSQLLDAYLARVHVTSESGDDLWMTFHGPDLTDFLVGAELEAAFDVGAYGLA